MDTSEPLRGVGFWFHPLSPSELPRPEVLAGHRLDPAEKRALVSYLRSGTLYESYRGQSWCRFMCGADRFTMGSTESTDGVWVWPEGLAHYVEAHDVELPSELVERARRGHSPPRTAPTARFSLDWWIGWGRARGACVDLGEPWEILRDAHVKMRLSEELARELAPGHPLEGERVWPVARRVDCDDVLFVVPSDWRLAIVHLTWSSARETDPRWPSTSFVTGWGAWNASRADGSR